MKLEDPRFEQEFVVYADDQVEARYVLTPSLMERLVEFKQKAGRPSASRFLGPNVNIAIETERNMFEPGVRAAPSSTASVCLEYLRDLEFAVGVVRTWT